MMFEVRVAEDKFLHWQAGAHLEQNLETARKWDVVGILGKAHEHGEPDLVDNPEDLLQQEEALPVLAPRPADLHGDVGGALHLDDHLGGAADRVDGGGHELAQPRLGRRLAVHVFPQARLHAREDHSHQVGTEKREQG